MEYVGEAQYVPIPEDRMIILSDLHGNVEALKGALSAGGIDPDNPDPVLCLGDIVGEYGSSEECIDVLQSIDAHCVKGNHDMLQEFTGRGRRAGVHIEDDISGYHKDWLERLPDYLVNDLFVACHGGPTEPQTLYLDDELVIEESLKSIDRRMLITGHTHEPDCWAYYPWNDEPMVQMHSDIGDSIATPNQQGPEGEQQSRKYFNPGSVAEPRGSSEASFIEVNFKDSDLAHLSWRKPGYSWDYEYSKSTQL